MIVPPELRCKALDNGHQCRRRKRKRGLCLKHYDRWRRKDGETRTERELRAIKRRAELREFAKSIGLLPDEQDPIFGKETSKDAEESDPRVTR